MLSSIQWRPYLSHPIHSSSLPTIQTASWSVLPFLHSSPAHTETVPHVFRNSLHLASLQCWLCGLKLYFTFHAVKYSSETVKLCLALAWRRTCRVWQRKINSSDGTKGRFFHRRLNLSLRLICCGKTGPKWTTRKLFSIQDWGPTNHVLNWNSNREFDLWPSIPRELWSWSQPQCWSAKRKPSYVHWQTWPLLTQTVI